MIFWFAIIYLAVLQGLTEFLPVSSSGHLALSQLVFADWGIVLPAENIFIVVLLHIGTLFAVIGFYRREIAQICAEWLGYSGTPTSIPGGAGRSWTIAVVVGTLVTMALALPFEDRIEAAFHEPRWIGLSLYLTAILLLVSHLYRKGETVQINQLTLGRAALIGAMQSIAVLPGVSRSGATIAAALLLGLPRQQAVTFSFLLSIPAILGGAVLSARKIESFPWLEGLVGVAVAALSGWFALQLLTRMVLRGRLLIFVFYCFVIGTITLVVAW